MSDEANPQPTRPPGPSWTPPSSGKSAPSGGSARSGGSAPPPPAPTPSAPEYRAHQGGGPAPDPTGGTPQPVKTGRAGVEVTPALIFGFVAIVGIVLGLFLKESPADGTPSTNLWDRLSELWSIVAILAALLTVLPALRSVVNLGEQPAWRIAAGGAFALLLWWVLFILPNINLNVSFLATVGVAAAVLAVWTSPGNPYQQQTPDSSSTS